MLGDSTVVLVGDVDVGVEIGGKHEHRGGEADPETALGTGHEDADSEHGDEVAMIAVRPCGRDSTAPGKEKLGGVLVVELRDDPGPWQEQGDHDDGLVQAQQEV